LREGPVVAVKVNTTIYAAMMQQMNEGRLYGL